MKRLAMATCMAALLCGWNFDARLAGQRPLINGGEPAGMAAHKRLIAEPRIANYDQPVQIVLPFGGQVSFFDGTGCVALTDPQTLLGFQVGPVYRLKVTGVIAGTSHEIYPTVEMVDRTWPPEQIKLRHPVKIVLSRDDMEAASAGSLVTKVVYVEDPDTALPYRQSHDYQATLDVGMGRDPYHVAQKLGRPIAIVRLGSRRPVDDDPDFQQGGYCPGVRLYSAPTDPLQLTVPPGPGGDVGVYDPQAGLRIPCQIVEQLPVRYRDEYVCDGNDRGAPATLGKDWDVNGIDLEDTVGHFETTSGRTVVSPSNRVCIYAPRFAAVRRVLQTNDTTIHQKLGLANEHLQIAHARYSDFSSTTLQNIQLQSNRKTERVNSIRKRTRGVLVERTVKLVGSRQALKPYENLSLVRFGEHVAAESARLGLAIQSALAWDSVVRAQITINRQQPIIVNDVTQTSDMIAIETRSGAELRLCKLASTISAQSGDIVEFTIRFDNMGRELIGNVTIIDNLSPRLEYIDGSAECTVPAELKTDDNDGGSTLLRWEITDPLPVNEGGIIRFQCRVR